MSERKDERWLDSRLRRAVDGTTPAFDAEAWKLKYAREFEMLLGRGRQTVGWGLPHRFLWSKRSWWGKPHPTGSILRGSFGKVAVAAAVMATAGILLVGRPGPGPDRPAVEPPVVDLQAPGRLVSMISLSVAFRRGGIDELDKQCERALERLGPRPTSVSMQDLLKDSSS
jgi:hypothetical protein